MATVGILHEYSDGEDWADFVERLDQYFVANNMVAVGDANRRHAVCGQKVYGLIKNLLSPQRPTDKSYEELCELVNLHLNPKAGLIISRYKFYTHTRQENQDISRFVADLCLVSLAEPCQFGAVLDEMLRDFFVIGVNHDVIFRKLAQEDDLDLRKAVKIAQVCMTTAENLKEILSKSQNSSSADTVNKIAQSSYKATPKPVVCLKPASSVARGSKNLCWHLV